jgi:hypothetical protein
MTELTDRITAVILDEVTKNMMAMAENDGAIVVNLTINDEVQELLNKASAATDATLAEGYRQLAAEKAQRKGKT